MSDPMADERPAGGRLAVYLHDALAGHLWLDERRRFVFQYDPSRLGTAGSSALSLALPLRQEPYPDDLSRPFFANLLPEAEIRRAIAKRLGISEKNDFTLLERIGGDCAGAVSVLPEGTPPGDVPGYRELDEDELHRIVAELPRKPFLAGERGIRLSLAGAQNKLPVYLAEGRVCLARGNAPSTHILKPPIGGLDGTVINEAFCMVLAGKMGLPVPEVTVRRNLDTLFIVKRFDREQVFDGRWVRLHQEDFCQALGFLPDQKYESEGGPSLARCFALMAGRSIRPAADRLALLGWVIFNVLIGNADAHAKNIAILLADPGPRLAPFYDLLCTEAYENVTEKLAMKIGGENRPDWLQARHWEQFADWVSMRPRLVLGTLTEMANGILAKAEETAAEFDRAYGPEDVLPKVLAVVRKRAEKIKHQEGSLSW